MHAILGTSEHCIATHPSDMAVAMMALGTTIHLNSSVGERSVPITEFYLVPGNTPDRENVVRKGEIITHVTLPALPANTKSHYLKRRDRASYEFALVSAAVIVDMNSNKIRKAQIALGGVGTRPWRSPEAEQELAGCDVSERAFRKAAEAALHAAKTYRNNGFKVELAKRTLVRALQTVTASA